MIDNIRSVLNAELTMLPYKFADLEEASKQKSQLEARYKLKSKSLFDEQWKLDKMRGVNDETPTKKAKDFKTLCALYFDQFLTERGFDFAGLKEELSENRATMERHLGKPWIVYLEFILKLGDELKEKTKTGPQGLLKRVV